MSQSQSYERVLRLQKKGAHLRSCILLYCLYGAVFGAGAVWFLRTLSPYAAVLTVILTLCLFLLTKSYLDVELEYAFFGGVLSVSKIYGKSRRKLLAECELSALLLADYEGESAITAVSALEPRETVSAISGPEAAETLLLVWEDGEGRRTALRIEGDERTEQILRRENPAACSIPLKLGKKPTLEKNKKRS